ncbi:MAG: hypothetical protein M3P48_07040 [Actinomycetota bacterium]|nr:hypothetical protein [Actinomycetota bacterium]
MTRGAGEKARRCLVVAYSPTTDRWPSKESAGFGGELGPVLARVGLQ